MSYAALGYTSNPCSSDNDCIHLVELCCEGYCREGIDVDEHCGEVVCPVGETRVEGECVKAPPTYSHTQPPAPTATTTVQASAKPEEQKIPIGLLALLATGTWIGVKLLKG